MPGANESLQNFCRLSGLSAEKVISANGVKNKDYFFRRQSLSVSIIKTSRYLLMPNYASGKTSLEHQTPVKFNLRFNRAVLIADRLHERQTRSELVLLIRH